MFLFRKRKKKKKVSFRFSKNLNFVSFWKGTYPFAILRNRNFGEVWIDYERDATLVCLLGAFAFISYVPRALTVNGGEEEG